VHMDSKIVKMAMVAALAVASATACATATETGRPSPGDPAASGVATSLVIQQFLRAVNANDLDTMARLFGTRDGPIVELYDRKQVDDRMFAIASILKHQDYSIDGTQIVPGRRDEATMINVLMSVDGAEVVVPYTLVWSQGESWLIEQIGLEAITNRR
ncbi:MAG: hypothetical protein ACRELX_14710, partial [Longimicrobiales bacterium]